MADSQTSWGAHLIGRHFGLDLEAKESQEVLQITPGKGLNILLPRRPDQTIPLGGASPAPPTPCNPPCLGSGRSLGQSDNATRWPWGGLCLPSTQNLTPCTSDCFPRISPQDERLFPNSRGPGKAYTCHPRIQACPPSSKDQTVGS